MPEIKSLDVKALRRCCDPEQFDFRTTEELDDLREVVGQPRAIQALQFGVGIRQEGFNIFALGTAGVNKRDLVRKAFEQAAEKDDVPHDWCYVYNFEQAHKPNTIRLPAGRGAEFRDDMDQLIEDLQNALSGAFESEEYRSRLQELQQEIRERQEQALEDLRKKAEERGMAMIRTPAGLVFAPVRDGEVISPEEFQQLPEEERKKLEDQAPELQEELQRILNQVPKWQRELRTKMDELNREMASFAVGGLLEELRKKYADIPEVCEHLDAVEEDVIKNVKRFVSDQDQEEGIRQQLLARSPLARRSPLDSPFLRRYQVNLLVDHSESDRAPVIHEDNPTYQNLIGRVEHTAHMGALITDFNLIKPGALHRANGGYLLLDAREVLLQPFSWDGLKRALRSNQVRIESPGQTYSLISTVSLEPEPIPLNVKVALLGEPLLYYLLSALEPDFPDLFKVAADFGDRMDRDSDNQKLYAQLIGSLARKHELRPLDRSAVARVIEQSARMAGDSEKLSTQTRGVADLLREADYWAGEAGKDTITAENVQKAIDAKIYRSDRIRERIQEEIQRQTILIDTEGAEVGQVNGLSVLMLGDFAFGKPNRITARVRLGKGEVVDIEREVELGGPIHSKGVFILSAFMGARYAHERPLSLSASLVFEQSYSGVEGDSASSAELYALLSAIAETPIKQSLAVTGSVNQHGTVQAIGGVNEKIEGFFDVCKARGLTGEQGVLIPSSNVKHLMLRQDVIDAVEDGDFTIYPVETVDQGIELLTGIPAGEADEEGQYPPDTLNGRVQIRLAEMARQRAEFSAAAKETEE